MGSRDKKSVLTALGPFFHGGFPGLGVDDYIETPGEHKGIFVPKGKNMGHPNHVFVTTDLDMARAYALMYARKDAASETAGDSRGTVYEVQQPKAKDLRIDPDFKILAASRGGYFSFYVKNRLRVTKVVDTVSSDPELEYKLLAPYQT